jgi:hypothetical protein
MKLRIHGNSIRFRLSQSDVAVLTSEGRLEELVQLTPAASDLFAYVLEKSSQCREVRAWRSDFKIDVTLPDDLVRSWATTNQVGIEQTQTVGEGGLLHIVIEKDFRCLHSRTDEDEGDNFPNTNDPRAHSN